ncbi:hypothetical protein [Variovorax defluvii]|uniref:hypothetical protein n=1 Tax=Variovorax defluvii TaxID=913761 RepID=UPI0031E940F2
MPYVITFVNATGTDRVQETHVRPIRRWKKFIFDHQRVLGCTRGQALTSLLDATAPQALVAGQ